MDARPAGLEWLDNLEQLVGKVAEVTDKRGKVHRLAPLGMRDVCEFKRFGDFWLDRVLMGRFRADEWFFLVYLALRHNVKPGEEEMTEADAAELFDGTAATCGMIAKAGMTLLIGSGWITARKKADQADPTQAPDAEEKASA